MPLQSGLKLCDKALDLFSDMKIGKKNTRYIVLKLNSDCTCLDVDQVVVKKSGGDQKEEYEEMMKELNMAEGRFIILDLEVPTKGSIPGMQQQQQCKQTNGKLFCIMWNPDDSGARSKMLYASALGTVVSKLKMDEGGVVVQANDLDELGYETLLEKGRKF